jgi:hypothetical protein
MGQVDDEIGEFDYLRYLLSALIICSDYDLDLDLESIWREFPNMPTPPPRPAQNCSTLCLNQSLNRWSEDTQHGNKRASVIECAFYPSFENVCAFNWTRPDPLSQITCADDIFLYISAFMRAPVGAWRCTPLPAMIFNLKITEFPFIAGGCGALSKPVGCMNNIKCP